MTNEFTFRIVAGIVFLVAMSISIYFRHQAERKGGKLRSTQGQQKLVLLRLIGLIGLLPFLLYLVNPGWVQWTQLTLPTWLRWTGAALGFGVLPALFWLFNTIGNNISPVESTRENHQLITHGPYRFIRHPLYTFGALLLLALSLVTMQWWLLLFFTVGFFLIYRRTRDEEANLVATFGDAYLAYMEQTGRFVPKLIR